VNPATRAIDWVFRYPLLQHDLPNRPGNGSPIAVPPDAWWNEWREVACHSINSSGREILVVATPDSDHLLAIDAASGTSLWSMPRNSGLHLAGVTQRSAIVIEPLAVRAHDVDTGRIRWRVEIGEISANGTISGNQLFQPLRSGGFAVVNLSEGTFQSSPQSDMVFGTPIPCAGGWVAQSDQSLHCLPYLETVRTKAEQRWESQRSDPLASVELARLDLQAAAPAKALERLEPIATDEAKSLRREAIQILLRGPTKQGMELGQQLFDLAESDDDRLLALRLRGEAAWSAGNKGAALNDFLDGLDLIDASGGRTSSYWPADNRSFRTVRADRILLGNIERLLADTPSPEVLAELEKLLDNRLAEASGRDQFAVQRFIDRLLPLEWARRALIANKDAVLYARSLEKSEPVLMTAAGSRNPATAATALQILAETQLQAGWRTESESLQRHILSRYPGTPLSNGQPMATSLTAEGAEDLRNRLLSAAADPWPTVTPEVEKEPHRNQDVYFMPVAVQCLPGSVLERLDVSVERTGRFVRFSAAGHSGTWQKELPGSPKTMRSGFANRDLVEAHGIGRLLILRVGTEVFGIYPFNENGEPIAQLTSLRMTVAPDLSEMPSELAWTEDPVPARVGIRQEGIRMVDGFGHSLDGLGPVRPRYMCFRSPLRLIAVELPSGKRLWERLDMPRQCKVLGDDDCVYLLRPEDQTMQVLSAIDGTLLTERPWRVSADDLLMHDGRFAWVMPSTAQSTVELRDLRDGTTVWSRQFVANSVPFAMDRTTVGVLEPGRGLNLIDSLTGSPLGEILSVDVPAKVERLVCLQDAQRWYVAVSEPVPRVSMLQAFQVWSGYRVSFVSGWFYAIDRQSADIAWRRRLESEALPRIGSQAAPVFVQMWKTPSELGPDNTHWGTMKIIDKRTGQELMVQRSPSMNPYFYVSPGEDSNTLKVNSEYETIRLKYQSEVREEPASDSK
jgi:hypothetical protein